MSLSKPSPESDYSLPEHSDSDLFSEDSAFHNQIKQVIFDVEIPDRLKDSILTSLVKMMFLLQQLIMQNSCPEGIFLKNQVYSLRFPYVLCFP